MRENRKKEAMKARGGRRPLALVLALGVLLLGGPVFAEFVVDGADGIVTDTATGLMWQRDTGHDGEAVSWKEAVAYCQGLTLAGFDDWRLPDSDELQTIIHHLSYNPVIDVRVFPDTEASGYWTATPYEANADYAWRIDFYYVGYVNISNKSNLYFVRAVRTLP